MTKEKEFWTLEGKEFLLVGDADKGYYSVYDCEAYRNWKPKEHKLVIPKEDIETLRQKLIEDIKLFYEIGAFTERQVGIALERKINRRFGKSNENYDEKNNSN
jgi:hypothetical protein